MPRTIVYGDKPVPKPKVFAVSADGNANEIEMSEYDFKRAVADGHDPLGEASVRSTVGEWVVLRHVTRWWVLK